MAREELFSFIPETQLTSTHSDPEFRVNINSSRMLYFPKEIVDIYDLDKKYFKFYADVKKKAIAWKYFSEGDLEDLAGMRKLGINNQSGAGVISIMKLLSAIGIKELNGSIKEIPVKKYKGQGYLTEEVNYIIVNEKNIKVRTKTDEDNKEAEGVSGDDPGAISEISGLER